MISVRHLTKTYDGKAVVCDVDLTIEPGRITSFIGPNGAGKSTLLSMMARLTEATSGEVLIDGLPLKDWNSRDLARRISILRQSNHLSIRLSVEELIAFGRFPHCGGRLQAEDEKQIEQAIRWMKLEDIRHRPLSELSGGQRQRAYIAMVLAQDTDCILLDEPLNNLDMKHAVEIMKTLRRITDELGKTVVIVLHDINFASCYSDRIVALADGCVRHDDETDNIIDQTVLGALYEMPFAVHCIGGRKICTYYEDGACTGQARAAI